MGKRILTALVGVPVLLGGMYLGGYVWASLIAIFIFIASFEFVRMMKNKNYNVLVLPLVVGEIVMIMGCVLKSSAWSNFALATTFLLVFFVAVFSFPKYKPWDIALTFMGLIYVGWAMCHLILLEQIDILLLLYLFIAIWGSDSGAYFCGRLFGKHKLAEKLSPKKTKEGAIGGIITAVVLLILVNLLVSKNGWFASYSTLQVVIMGVVIAIIGTIGDLVESMLKRMVDVKDSGNILPGHGGILDRFDSIILAVPFVYYLHLLAII